MRTLYKTVDEFRPVLQESKEVIIYGAGAYGWFVYDHIDSIFGTVGSHDKIAAFCDRNAHMLREECPKPVYSVDEMRGKSITVIIAIRFEADPDGEYIKDIIRVFEKNDISCDCFDVNSMVEQEGNEIYRVGAQRVFTDSVSFLRYTYPHDKKLQDIVDEYVSSVQPIVREGKYTLLDTDGSYMNIRYGIRRTCGEPGKNAKNIYFIGDSRVFSVFTSDEDTICSLLQKRSDSYRVLNYGSPFRDIERMANQIGNAEIGRGDLVFIGAAWHHFFGKDELVYIAYRLSEINRMVCSKGAALSCFILPSIWDLQKLTDAETDIKGSFIPVLSEYRIRNYNNAFKMYLQILGILNFDLSTVFDLINDRTENIFLDQYHFSSYGNSVIADHIHMLLDQRRYMEAFRSSDKYRAVEEKMKKGFDDVLKKYSFDDDAKRFAEDIRKAHPELDEHTAAIVMNANPFTNGHLYLVEKASRENKTVIIFVLSEDKSFFSADDRYEMVKRGCSHLNNVIVERSGEFIISQMTFPEYFEKDRMQDVRIDAGMDLITFAGSIAPVLGIDVRYVGAEPADNITDQYNAKMKEILPEYGIKVIEVERLKFNNEYISGSKIREYLKTGQPERIEELCPMSTVDIIKDYAGNVHE